ncbi:MAG: glutamate-1-semialdehyde 2,1-aminomutase [Candidatus Calescibacterium sp.]|nr:glutamate-1-semialdehyde 2,1-aminomutase [Candidatus Calescibacterium sp.]
MKSLFDFYGETKIFVSLRSEVYFYKLKIMGRVITSQELARKATDLMPGGVNSPVRSFVYVENPPIYVDSAKGSKIKTVDGDEILDFVLSWGAIILGHAHTFVVREVSKSLENGTSYGLNHTKEIEFCEILKKIFPESLFRVMNSGTEATMTAVRLARAYTKKKYIIKFSGCFHGHSDQFLTSAGSGMATLSIPSSAGVPEEFTSCTITLDFNSDQLEEAFKKYEIAGVILEPLPGNMGVIIPEEKFLKTIFDLCEKNSAVVIFDEVITGFRTGWGGISNSGKIKPIIFDSDGEREIEIKTRKPDITTFGKVVGGGFPIGIVRSERKIMEMLAPSGQVYQAGTFSANPISLTGGISTLKTIAEYENGFYKKLRQITKMFFDVLKNWSVRKGISISINAETGMLSVFFTEKSPKNFEEAKKSDTKMFKRLFSFLLKNGILIPPSPFEAWFVSISHTEDDVQKFSEVIERF